MDKVRLPKRPIRIFLGAFLGKFVGELFQDNRKNVIENCCASTNQKAPSITLTQVVTQDVSSNPKIPMKLVHNFIDMKCPSEI